MPNGIKKSLFTDIGTGIISGSATFDFVVNGQNIKVTKDELVKQFGTTGQVIQVGDPLCTPVLDDQGSIKGIRNIADGFGIVTEIDASNCLKISTGFTFDETGAVLVDDPLSPTPLFRSLVGGDGISVSSSGGQIQISSTDEPASTKTVFVNAIGDFPSAVAGVITLADDTDYFIASDITTPDRFVAGNNSQFRGSGAVTVELAYTGTGTMITSVDKFFDTLNITLTASTGELFDYSNSAGNEGTAAHVVQDVIGSGSTLGSFENLGALTILNSTVSGVNGGFSFSGSQWGDFILQLAAVGVQNGTLFDLGSAVFNSFESANFLEFNSAGTTVFSGLVDSGNIAVGGQGYIRYGRFRGEGTQLTNITAEDDSWYFDGNDKIANTAEGAMVWESGNIVATTISASDTPVLLDGVFTEQYASHFTTSAGGRITYSGDRGISANIAASISAVMVSGGAKLVSFYLAKNGVVIEGSVVSNSISSGTGGNTGLIWTETLEADDFIEIWVENNSDSTNVIGVDVKLEVG